MTNPSFNFKWDTKKKSASAKVFSRKRSSKNSSVEKTSISSNKVSVDRNASEQTVGNEVSSSLPESKHKRNKQFIHKTSNTESTANSSGDVGRFRGKKALDNYTSQRNYYKPARTTGKAVTEKLFTSDKSFKDLEQIHHHIISNLEKNNFLRLTTVQEKAIPVICKGKNTLIRSQTGSGKTLAYAVPILNTVVNITPKLKRQDGIQALIVVPTRELALQTHEIFIKINTFQWIVTGHLCGGENRKTEKDRLRKGVHVLIGTPGRLLDHMLHTSAFKANTIKYLVLDEADRLLDMGFRKDIIKLVEEVDKSKINSKYDPLALLKASNSKSDIDSVNETEQSDQNDDSNLQRQTILLSATLSKGVTELAEFAMKDHIFVDALDSADSAENNSLVIPDTVKQQFLITLVKERLFTLSALLVTMSKRNSKVFVFMASGHMVEFHYQLFTNCLVKMPKNRGKLKNNENVEMSEDEDDEGSDGEDEEVVLDMPFFKLHGSMDQQQRKEVFQGFKASTKGVLLCTDVAARGIDVPTADCIIQYTGPQTYEDYLHRVGRTGRAGKAGQAIIFLTSEEEQYVQRLEEHNVFLKRCDPRIFFSDLCELMEDSNPRFASFALQRRYENAVANNKALHKAACLAYSSWARFYNSYPASMRQIFSIKKVNTGHYVSSFAIRDTPSRVTKVVRGQVKSIEKPRFNKKLANHEVEEPFKSKSLKRKTTNDQQKRKKRRNLEQEEG